MEEEWESSLAKWKGRRDWIVNKWGEYVQGKTVVYPKQADKSQVRGHPEILSTSFQAFRECMKLLLALSMDRKMLKGSMDPNKSP